MLRKNSEQAQKEKRKLLDATFPPCFECYQQLFKATTNWAFAEYHLVGDDVFSFTMDHVILNAEPIKRKLSLLLEPTIPAKYRFGEMEWKETRKGGPGASRGTNIPSKRNHTIGLGELDQLNLIVTESVIRWASCTHIPTTPSLRLSLVC